MAFAWSKPKEHWLREADRKFADRLAESDPRLAGVYDNALYRAYKFRSNAKKSIIEFLPPLLIPELLLEAFAERKENTSYHNLTVELLEAAFPSYDLAIGFWATAAREWIPGRRLCCWLIAMGWIVGLGACFAPWQNEYFYLVFLLVFGVFAVLGPCFYFLAWPNCIYFALRQANLSARVLRRGFEDLNRKKALAKNLIIVIIAIALVVGALLMILLNQPTGHAPKNNNDSLSISERFELLAIMAGASAIGGAMMRAFAARCKRNADKNFAALIDNIERIRRLYLEHAPDYAERK